MKKNIFLVPLLFLLLSPVPSLSAAEEPITVDETKTAIEIKDKAAPINVGALESSALKELSDSTQTTLTEKKKDASDAVVEGQKALVEKETVQNKVDTLEQELQETKTKIEKAEKGKTDVRQLEQKSRQLEKEHQVLVKELDEKTQKAKKAFAESSRQQEEIDKLKNQLRQFEIEKNKRYSPRKKALLVATFIIVMFIILFVKDKLVGLFEDRLISQGKKRHSVQYLKARTYLRIFNWSLSILVISIAIFFILELFGFDSTTTLAGAGFLGIAVGFGAQQFVRDILSGLFIVFEGQFGVNDFISVGKHSGNVEDINLRFTKLRSYDGNVIYVANGDIHSVVNYGKGFANSVINFYIDTQQNIDPVFSLIEEVVNDLSKTPELANHVLSDVQLLGINAFTPTGIEVKFRVKTVPQSQWMVGRAIRLALKQRFDKDGIKLFQYQHNAEAP